jgi:uncharacterized protein (TIGR02145 family)
MYRFIICLAILIQAIAFADCNNGVFADSRDNKTYKWVKIGNQTWMAENMNYKPSSGNFWCHDNKETNCEKYGKLYDWNSAVKACPSGWHLPSEKECVDLMTAVGGQNGGKKLKAKSGWKDNGNGTDDFGFSALPGGYFDKRDDSFSVIGESGAWWMTTDDSNYDDIWYMEYNNDNIDGKGVSKSNSGFSIRCIQDDYSSALQTHFAKGTLGTTKPMAIEMFFQSVSKTCDYYTISGKSKTKVAEDAFNGTLIISSIAASSSCKSGENEIKGSYDLKEKESKTSGHFVGSFTACEKNGKLSRASFKGDWVKHANGNKTPCNFEL